MNSTNSRRAVSKGFIRERERETESLPRQTWKNEIEDETERVERGSLQRQTWKDKSEDETERVGRKPLRN